MSSSRGFLVVSLLGTVLLGGAGRAEAKILATGLMLSSSADLMDCFVSNISDAPVPIASAKMFTGQGGEVAGGTDGCSGINLGAGKTCTVSKTTQAARFVVQFTAADRAVRAQCQFTDDQNGILATMEAR